MADPLGFVSGSAGAARPIMPGAQGPSRVPAPGEPSFKDVLMDSLKEVNGLQQDANKAIEDLQTGKRDDLEGVILATQRADTAFRMLQSVRNKVMEAYDELKQMRT